MPSTSIVKRTQPPSPDPACADDMDIIFNWSWIEYRGTVCGPHRRQNEVRAGQYMQLAPGLRMAHLRLRTTMAMTILCFRIATWGMKWMVAV